MFVIYLIQCSNICTNINGICTSKNRLLECITGSMVGKVQESSGYNKLTMKFVLIELHKSCLTLLESQSLMRVLR